LTKYEFRCIIYSSIKLKLKSKIMETSQTNPAESTEDKRKNKKYVKAIGAFAAGTAAVVGSYIAFGPDGEQSPKPITTTVVEAPDTTEVSPGVQPDEGESGGVVVSPDAPEVTVPAESATTEPGPGVEPDDGESGGVVVSPDAPEVKVPAEAQAENN
jgi:hypothetical protein